MIHPCTGATIVSVNELRAFLDESSFPEDAPVGVILWDSTGKPLRVMFPERVDRAKGTGLPDMLVLVAPKQQSALSS